MLFLIPFKPRRLRIQTCDYRYPSKPTRKLSVPYCAAIVYIFVQYLCFRCPRCVRIRIYFCSKFLILFFYSLEFSHLTFGGLRADLGHACTYQAARSVYGCSLTYRDTMHVLYIVQFLLRSYCRLII
jgi:hypothetical protein